VGGEDECKKDGGVCVCVCAAGKSSFYVVVFARLGRREECSLFIYL